MNRKQFSLHKRTDMKESVVLVDVVSSSSLESPISWPLLTHTHTHTNRTLSVLISKINQGELKPGSY